MTFKPLVPVAALVPLLLLAACGGDAQDAPAGDAAADQATPVAGTGAPGGAIEVVLTEMENGEMMGLPTCEVDFQVNNGSNDGVRNLTLSYIPTVGGTDASAAAAGGDMTANIRKIPAGGTADEDTDVRGTRCENLSAIQVKQVICETESRTPCHEQVTLRSAVNGVGIALAQAPE